MREMEGDREVEMDGKREREAEMEGKREREVEMESKRERERLLSLIRHFFHC